jgi:glycosyltransferase involved in cell wall biosynthesis
MSAARSPHVLLMVENVSLARDHRLRKQAGALVDAGYRVSVICRRDPGNRAVVGVRLLEYPAPADATTKFGYLREYGYSLVMAAWSMLRLFVVDRFAVIQVSGTPDIYFLITAPMRLLGCRVLFDQRDLSPELYELRYGNKGQMYRLLCRLERASYRAADHVIVVNRSLARIAHRRGGIDHPRLSIVGNGPQLRLIRPGVPDPSLRRGRRHLCCWVGMMGPQDQVLLAVEAVRQVVQDHGRTDCQFVFVGDGECREAAMRRAAEAGIDEFVSFPGWLPQERAFAWLAAADLGIEPNLEDIVSPVKGMEYMAFGLPFVAFDVVETRRLAGDAARYAPRRDVAAFADLIDELLDDPVARERMGSEGRRRVEDELAWDKQARVYVGIFDSMLGRPERRAAPAQRVSADVGGPR